MIVFIPILYMVIIITYINKSKRKNDNNDVYIYKDTSKSIIKFKTKIIDTDYQEVLKP